MDDELMHELLDAAATAGPVEPRLDLDGIIRRQRSVIRQRRVVGSGVAAVAAGAVMFGAAQLSGAVGAGGGHNAPAGGGGASHRPSRSPTGLECTSVPVPGRHYNIIIKPGVPIPLAIPTGRSWWIFPSTKPTRSTGSWCVFFPVPRSSATPAPTAVPRTAAPQSTRPQTAEAPTAAPSTPSASVARRPTTSPEDGPAVAQQSAVPGRTEAPPAAATTESPSSTPGTAESPSSTPATAELPTSSPTVSKTPASVTPR
jgi:hypothetical protein